MSNSARTSILKRLKANRSSRAVQEKPEHTVEASRPLLSTEWVAKEPDNAPKSKAALDRFKKLLTNNHAELFVTNESHFENTLMVWLEEHCQNRHCIVSEHPELKKLLPNPIPCQLQGNSLAELSENANTKKTLFHEVADRKSVV